MIPMYYLTIVMVAVSFLLPQGVRAAPAQAPNAVPTLIEWTDPTEHAFTVKVPIAIVQPALALGAAALLLASAGFALLAGTRLPSRTRLALIAALYLARAFVIPLLLGILASYVLRPAVDVLGKCRIPCIHNWDGVKGCVFSRQAAIRC